MSINDEWPSLFGVTVESYDVHCPLQFQLTLADKEMLEREDRSESQQEILRRISKDLPIYTRTTSGGRRQIFTALILRLFLFFAMIVAS